MEVGQICFLFFDPSPVKVVGLPYFEQLVDIPAVEGLVDGITVHGVKLA